MDLTDDLLQWFIIFDKNSKGSKTKSEVTMRADTAAADQHLADE